MYKSHHIAIFVSFVGSLLYPLDIKAQKIEILGTTLSPIKLTPKKETGLTNIYVLENTDKVKMCVESSDPDNVSISNFTMLGAAFATPVDNIVKENNTIYVPDIIGDSGYIVQDGSSVSYIWIVDYSKHFFSIDSISLSTDNSCEETILDVVGNAEPINYYTINGKKETLSRDINIEYKNLEFNENSMQFEEKNISKNIDYFTRNIVVYPSILCSTDFIVTGDRFLAEWKMEESYKSENFSPIATMVFTTVNEENKMNGAANSSNQISSDTEYLGGSAPAEISFRAYVSDAVVHNEWQMATDENFEDITYRFNQQDLSYTFTSEGTTYVRFVGSNYDGTCQTKGDVYVVNIGASKLLVPNAFSPNDDGVNDIWKISYKSLLDFKCWIFNKQGHEIYHYDNPDGGWDGKYNGKYVKPGVYYYVIQATGSDGKKYKKSGDINIIHSKGYINKE